MSLDKSMEEENELLRDKLNIVREQNASLTSRNHLLTHEMEAVNFELKQAKARVGISIRCICFNVCHIAYDDATL